MKTHPKTQMATRLATLCLTLALLPLASCRPEEKKRSSWLPLRNDPEESFCRDTLASLSDRFGDLKERVTREEKQNPDEPSWPFATLLVLAVGGFALVSGASLGSRARRRKEGQS